MPDELLYQIALTLVPNIGAIHARLLVEHVGNAAGIFSARKAALEKIDGIGGVRAQNIKTFNAFKRAEEEIRFIEKYKIQPLFIKDENYPRRFLNCYDPPVLFYYRGTADLNNTKMVAIVGTRTSTAYGRQVTEQLVTGLAALHVTVVSGLAFGIDAVAHKTALKCHIPTVGVVGHGLDTIYPQQHKDLAKEMLQHGGILTEFMSNTKPDKHNFPIRNRVVAGITDATIVVETGTHGGSMITAGMANSYNRDVFAFPGKTTDCHSVGCNYLIRTNRAVLLTDAGQLAEAMGWEKKNKKPKQQRELFLNLGPDETVVVNVLKEKEAMPIDELHLKCHLSCSAVAAAMLNLEFEGIVASLPGKLYKLV